MLGQHPACYGFPELNLFLLDSIDELLRLGASDPSYLTGLLRSIAELEFQSQTETTLLLAKNWLESKSHWTCLQMFDYLLDRLQGKVGIDKSPRTCLSKAAIDRALHHYPNAKILHLTRHPISTLESQMATHLQYSEAVNQSWLANIYLRLWNQSQRLILSTTEQLLEKQVFRLCGEDLLRSPDTFLVQLENWLGYPCDSQIVERMKHPENSPYAHPAPLGLRGDGDIHFQLSPTLRQGSALEQASSSPGWRIDKTVLTETEAISVTLGYSIRTK